jgi:uncharacterized protein YjbI with pentapeptide repeats
VDSVETIGRENVANPEDLKLLMRGREQWNRSRPTRADLSRADLRHRDLSGFDLRDVDFTEADLSDARLAAARLAGCSCDRAHFIGAVLIEARAADASFVGAVMVRSLLRSAEFYRATFDDATLTQVDASNGIFTDASLRRANLSRAILVNTDFYRADMTGADLRGSHLYYSRFNGTDIVDADFTDAYLGETVMSAVALGKARLGEAIHRGRSVVDVSTLLSQDADTRFLRGIGLPELFIEYRASLARPPFEFYSCFISYSSRDRDVCQRLHNDLQGKGVRCWFAPEDLRIGDKFRHQIDESIRVHDKVLLVLSEHSIVSDWVENEVEAAFEKEHHTGRPVLFPIRLDDAVIDSPVAWAGTIRRTRHIGDFTGWKDHDSYQKAFSRLLRDLEAADKSPESGVQR